MKNPHLAIHVTEKSRINRTSVTIVQPRNELGRFLSPVPVSTVVRGLHSVHTTLNGQVIGRGRLL